MKPFSNLAKHEDLIPGVDTIIYLDEEWYTTSGVLKMTGMCKTTLSTEIRDKKIEVFRHPQGNLFSKDSLHVWTMKRTAKAKK
ncbi:hypothetical protein [Fibrobacter sp.]|uniref:hypothetical protein n=1 Tax=Fibrobacter sp. TaxID=35828 RepID=UPI00388E27F6